MTAEHPRTEDSTHTPGPWTAYKATFGWSVRARTGERIAQEQTEADARLIGIAPELLEALEEAVLQLLLFNADPQNAAVLRGQRVLAKARGQS